MTPPCNGLLKSTPAYEPLSPEALRQRARQLHHDSDQLIRRLHCFIKDSSCLRQDATPTLKR